MFWPQSFYPEVCDAHGSKHVKKWSLGKQNLQRPPGALVPGGDRADLQLSWIFWPLSRAIGSGSRQRIESRAKVSIQARVYSERARRGSLRWRAG